MAPSKERAPGNICCRTPGETISCASPWANCFQGLGCTFYRAFATLVDEAISAVFAVPD